MNSPLTFTEGDGIAFYMIVNDCVTASQIDQANGLTTYTDSECLSQAASEAVISKIAFNSKVMS